MEYWIENKLGKEVKIKVHAIFEGEIVVKPDSSRGFVATAFTDEPFLKKIKITIMEND